MQNIDTHLLINSLHDAHEKIEELLLLNKRANSALHETHDRLNRILRTYPDYWRYETLQAKYTDEQDDTESIELTFGKIDLHAQLLERLSVRIRIMNGRTILFIERNESSPYLPFSSWPLSAHPEIMIPCVQNFKSVSPTLAQTLTSLGTTDWKTLTALTKMLAELFSSPTEPLSNFQINFKKISEDLMAQSKVYESWPNTMRFDSIKIGHIAHSEQYHTLNLELINININKKNYPTLEFGLATVDSENSHFGSNPRLEFPESCQTALENWYAESKNERGEKLELRFAAPNALDTNVWSRISDTDKLLITGIISKLPEFIERVATAYPTKSLRWEDWKTLAVETRSIFIQNMTASLRANRAESLSIPV